MSEQLARDIAILAELFKSGGWRHLQVEAEGLSLFFSNDPEAASSTRRAPPRAQARIEAAIPATGGDKPVEPDPAWRPIAAPNLGTFYRAPKPGSAPFVEVGDVVAAETEICLLEVMKLFTSVKAGIAGIVRQIVARDAELVEGGQPLVYIEPQGA